MSPAHSATACSAARSSCKVTTIGLVRLFYSTLKTSCIINRVNFFIRLNACCLGAHFRTLAFAWCVCVFTDSDADWHCRRGKISSSISGARYKMCAWNMCELAIICAHRGVYLCLLRLFPFFLNSRDEYSRTIDWWLIDPAWFRYFALLSSLLPIAYYLHFT